jgi:histidinol-phosphatase (PHP family)
MDYNYHTHTYRCGHADGEDEKYVKRAIECGIKHMGFSDHAPFVFPDGGEIGCHVQQSDAAGYIESIKNLRKKYADKIDLMVGFEMEYMPTHFDKMLENAKNTGAEYLILGQHYISDGYPNAIASGERTESEERICQYVDCVCRGIRSGAFSYVAHPDMMKFVGSDEIFKREMEKLCVCSLENNIPLEINCLGIRTGRFYPNPRFWEVVSEVGSPVTFGFDAHTPEDAFDGKSLEAARWLVKRYKLNYIGKPNIIKLN